MDFDDSKGSTPLTKTPSTDVWHHPCICDVRNERIFVSVNENDKCMLFEIARTHNVPSVVPFAF